MKIRRATRHDLPAVGALLGRAVPTRFGRRAVADRRDEIYVADEVGRGLVGVIGLAYRRSLAAGGVVVDVDPLEGQRDAVVAGLLDFAVARARGRGCVRLVLPERDPQSTLATAAHGPWVEARVRVRDLGGAG